MRALTTLWIVALLVAPMSPVRAECLKDRSGEVFCGAGPCDRDREGNVFCARSRYGSVVRTRDGQIVCGVGRCAKDRRGQVICSSMEDGGVEKQMDGTIRCMGSCEPGSTALCERVPAGS